MVVVVVGSLLVVALPPVDDTKPGQRVPTVSSALREACRAWVWMATASG